MILTKWFRVTIHDHDYHTVTYSVAVDATSVTQAIAMGTALIGQKKLQREGPVSIVGGGKQYSFRVPLMDPDVRIEKIGLEDFWDERDEVKVNE